MRSSFLLVCLLGTLFLAPPAGAVVAEDPWPPRPSRTPLFVHYGEEHWNDADGKTILPKVVSESARYRPAMVTMSGDKARNGTEGDLGTWRRFMAPYDRAGIPYFPAAGNHDRLSPPGIPPGLQGLGIIPATLSSFGPYRDVFSDRPYPFGDGAAYGDPKLKPSARPAGEAPGASTHYVVDYDTVRWIFVDNSCWSISRCDVAQNPPFPDSEGNPGQFEWLERRANEASRAGRTVFVVMHMPTRDPRDQSHSDPVAQQHVMGKSEAFADNPLFEQVAERTGVDGVFLGHIKGQILYRGRGRVPYYVDGGAGGELYTTGPVGTDHGYWHGYRLIQVSRGRVVTDAVPVFVDGGITLQGADVVRPGALERYVAFGRQPVFNDPAKVERLELRDPAPRRPASGSAWAGFLRGGGWIFVPVVVLLLGGLAMPAQRSRRRRGRRLATVAAATGGAVVMGVATVSLAQQSVPTATPVESLPAPARMFTSANPFVLGPKAPASDDVRRDPVTQTKNGVFRARCPGRTRVRVTSGYETTVKDVTVPSRPGRIARSLRVTSRRSLRLRSRPRLRHRVARIDLAQGAEVLVRLRRRGRTVRTLKHVCARAGRMTVLWDGRARRRGRLVRSGRYQLEAKVRSDRRTIRRARIVRVSR